MRLSKIKIENFKRIKDVELGLADINILVGTNASGKSSIIQALHLATCLIRQASRIDSTKTSTVGIEELDYVPSENYSMLGHQTAWGNRAGSPSSKAAFTFSSDAGEFSAQCELRSARNAGISITGQIPSELNATLRGKNKFFSAYIPGISGIPNREEKRSKKVVLKACSYGDSNVILRNVLLLLKQQSDLATVEEWIGRTVGNIKLFVDHDDEKSLTIDCSAEIDGLKRPIELIGTGYLQLIQLFSYILLFRPGILLVDEPDIHLHPSVQEKLVQTLADVAKSHDVRILLTTHSPFIVRGAPSTANVYWVQEGRLEESNRAQVELALGWGAFGKKILVISEDTNTTLLRKLIAQWPQIDRQVTFYPGTGFKNLPTPDQVKEISAALGGKFQVLVHRDRDSLTGDESKKLTKRYTDVGADLWLPAFSDVEGYFCQPSFLAELVGCTPLDAEAHIADVNQKQAGSIKDQFASQRAAHNQELYTAGGSPTNDDVWNGLQAGTLKGAKGKFMLKQLKNKIGQTILSDASISANKFKSEIGTDLREKLEAVLKRA
jgi:AAA15 family ATPase/GTPase